MKRIIFIIIIIITTISIINSLRTIISLWQKQTLLSDAKKELIAKQNQNEQLRQQLAQAKGQDFVESEARNKLFLAKPGETTIIIPKDLMAAKKKILEMKLQPNWEQWLAEFF